MVDNDRGRSLCMLTLLIVLVAAGCAPSSDGFPVFQGPYLGQTPPDSEPQLFAPGIISTGMYTRDVAMTPDGNELYFGVLLGRFNTILETHVENGRWTPPEVAPFARDSRFFHLEPAISPDGQRFFFLSTRLREDRAPLAEEIRTWSNEDIWVMDRVEGGWSEPYNLGPPVNTDAPEFFPSVTRDGTLYFTRGSADGRESLIYRSRLVDGRYQEPERLGPEVNSTPSQFNAFIAPDEQYLIICTGGRADTHGGTDYYVVFRTADDAWSEPVNLGEAINTEGAGEYSPYVSPDGRYFFFMATRPLPDPSIPDSLSLAFLRRYRADPESGNAAIYWVDAGFINRLRPEGW
jgi:hypothetical protein